MERELDCEIVRDLLPLYVDGMVSDASKESIGNHLEHCTDCSEIYQNMVCDLEAETPAAEVQDVRRFLNKTKKMFLLYGLGALILIAILACLIVDISLNKGITWSLIPVTSCVFAYIFIYVISTCKKNKGCAAMVVISIGTFVLLSVIQISRYYLMETGTFWIFRYGFPLLLVWLLITWIPVLAKTFLKWNIWDCAALFMFFVIAGNYATKLIIGDYILSDIFSMRNFAGNASFETVGIVLFVIIGRIRGWKK